MLTSIVLIAGVVATGMVCFHPRVLGSRAWRATVTPLASIIGSGFLVVAPILAQTVGSRAWVAMIFLCAVGYLYGVVLRYNISQIEPQLPSLPGGAASVESLSSLALTLSYFVSVAYYLNLFAAFGLRLVGIESPLAIRAVATAAIAVIGAIGFGGGLRALERLEIGAVGLKLSVIGGLLAALAVTYVGALANHDLVQATGVRSPIEAARITLGLVVLVQGFETSRYLGEAYDAATRVWTMRLAQLVATGIYVAFVFMMTALFPVGLHPVGGETEVINMLKPLGAIAPLLLIMAALASQSSAAVADMNGASGLLHEFARHRLPVRLANLAVAFAAIAITWNANIFEIITYASKAFIAYYGLQSVLAAWSAAKQRQYGVAGLAIAGVLVAVIAVAWAVPASA